MEEKLVIFDLDGTLLDTLDDLAGALNYALRSCDLRQKTREEVRALVGNGIRNLVMRAVPETAQEKVIEEVYRLFCAYYDEHCADKTRPYNGILPLLVHLRSQGMKLAVVSNKSDEFVVSLCRKYFGELIDFALGAREGLNKKPSPEPLDYVLRELNAKSAIYIGDSEVDIETADNAGMEYIIVTWGFRDRAQLENRGAKILADTPEELRDLLTCG